MSNISTSLGPVLSQFASASAQGSGNAARDAASNSNGGTALISQTAAVVTLSSNARTRAASSGEGRQIDATFDKQEAGAKRADKKKEEGTGGQQTGSISVSA